MASIAKEMGAVEAQINSMRKSGFEVSGRVMSHIAGASGLLAGVAADSLLLGIIGGGAGSWIIRKLVGGGIVKHGPKIISAIGRVGETLALPGRAAAVKMLSYAQVEDARDQVADLDPMDIGAAARQGYSDAGLDPIMVERLASFQQNRAALMQQIPYSLTARDRVRWSKILDALEDPRRITERLSRLELTREDLFVLKAMFPRILGQLREAADEILRENRKGLSAKKLNMLRMLARPDEQDRLAQWTQQPPQRKPAGQPTGAAGASSARTKTDLQRVQGGLGK